MNSQKTKPGGMPMTSFDPRVALATNLESQQGVYALLIGSGVSTAVGIPTGWGVVETLVRRIAAASGTPIVDDEWEKWWGDNGNGEALGYSTLLEAIAPTAPARRAILAGFFEPTEGELDDGVKAPGPAHQAIAQLVARGAVRVIVTTNFDRLLERALEAEGVMPQVIASEAAAVGMEPLQHARATIVKLHGDYASLDQRNTVDELQSYSPALADLLSRILDEYGLIVAGWSGEWDTALVAAIEKSASRRYPLYWTARGEASDVAKRLTARSGSQMIENTTAETFFPDLLHRVQAVAAMTEPPASFAMKLARLRRALPDPVRQLEVRELFEAELDSLESWANERLPTTDIQDWDDVDAVFDDIYRRFDTLFKMFAQAVVLDRDQQHTDLWVWVIQRALNARTFTTGQSVPWWEKLTHYPAFLLLRVGVMAALVSHHELVIVRLVGEPRWSSVTVQSGKELPAHEVLHLNQILDTRVIENLPRWGGTKYYYPSSRLVREQLRTIATDLVGTSASERLLDRMEYRMALAHTRIKVDGTFNHNPPSGDYLGAWPYPDQGEPLMALTRDFIQSTESMVWLSDGETREELEAFVARLDEQLRGMRRDY